MSRRPFRLKLFTGRSLLKQIKSDESISFRGMHTSISTGPNFFKDSFNLVERAIGDEINYGTLLAYLFRRFGYPNRGWDDYKELACYELTTPMPDMYLRIIPYVGNSSEISITPMIRAEVSSAIDAYDRNPITDYSARMRAWIQANAGIPEWSAACMEALREGWGPFVTDFWTAVGLLSTHYAGRKDRVDENGKVSGLDLAWIEWAEAQTEAYKAIETLPPPLYRTDDVDAWSDDDPLKPYAKAIFVALADLKTPVRVRDSAINAFGQSDEGRVILSEPAVAGMPCGDLGNQAPREFAQLHGLILRLGKGNAKRGIEKVLKTMSQEGSKGRASGKRSAAKPKAADHA